ncbi:hypothetical protein [Streptomyces sp. NRRL B-24484]|uniref:hypothetical protein n=1 Tax=Streptomyces sp. NRRL B-24484 TaxID=1463833 RepID=UPI000693B389|nr:hypothetical protein [Streptomyces sp. NRRL B-24484]
MSASIRAVRPKAAGSTTGLTRSTGAASAAIVHTITDLVALLDSPAAGKPQPADDEGDEDGEPWGALGWDLAIAELCLADPGTGGPSVDEDPADVDQEAEAHANGTL